jgi:hypothetical protein
MWYGHRPIALWEEIMIGFAVVLAFVVAVFVGMTWLMD